MKEDCNLPEVEHLKDVKNNIKNWFEEGKNEVLVTVLATLGKELVIEARKGAEVWVDKGDTLSKLETLSMDLARVMWDVSF